MASHGNPLAAAAKAAAQLKKADDFTKSVEGKTPSMFAPQAPAKGSTAAKASDVPAKKPSFVNQESKEGDDIASGLKWNQQQVDQVTPKKYHKGGKIEKDGVQVVDAEKGETVLPKKGKKRATELAMKHLEGMKEGMEKHAAKHSVKKTVTKKHGKVKKMHVHVNDDNTFSMTHEHHPNEDGSQNPDTTHSAQDMDQLMDHMQDHLGTPNPGEAEAEAGPAAPAAPAPDAAAPPAAGAAV